MKDRGRFKQLKDDKTGSILFESGAMRSELISEPITTSKIKFGIPSSAPRVEKLKSFNHNTGDTLPQREFIPSDDKTFKQPILTGIKAIIQDVLSDESDSEDEA